MIGIVTVVCLGMLLAAGGLCLARLVRAETTADRLVALDLLLLIIVLGVAVAAVRSGDSVFIDLLVVVSLLGFIGTSTVARFIERRGW